MKKNCSKLILRLFGWEINNQISVKDLKKGIIIMAPHTSNIDFIIGKLAFYTLNIKANFLIKKELFVFPLGNILKSLGGVPVNRSRGQGTINKVIEMMNHRENFLLVITPEGSRSYRKYWKKGFYHIALKTNTPIILSYIDYKKKEGGFHSIFYPSGDIQKDFEEIMAVYQNKTAKFPKKFCNVPKI